MSPTRILVTLLIGVLCLCASSQQPSEGSGPEVFGNPSSKDLDAVRASREAAQEELARRAADFEEPSIDSALLFSDRGEVLAIARINSVRLPKDANGHTIISFHVERLLTRKSRVTDFKVESLWNPKKVEEADAVSFGDFNNSETALDQSEPKVGNRYILGYLLQDYDIDRSVYISGVVDLQDPAQAELVAGVTRFLKLDADAAIQGDETYLAMLNDSLPWFRDLAVDRLVESDSCYKSRHCAEKFEAAVKRKLESDLPNERKEGIGWLRAVGSEQVPKRGHVLSDLTLSTLLRNAVKDSNLEVGDEAFEDLEWFEVYRTGSPGDCYEIVPMLRRAVHWKSKHDQVPIGLVSEYGCIPSK